MCTGIQLKAEDDSIIFARTLEFGIDLHSDVLVVPRNHKLKASCDNAHEWTTKYGMVGANAEKQPIIVDGVNEKGLTANLFYFAGYADFQKVDASEKTLSSVDLGTWILSNCANVAEIKEAIHKIKVSNANFKPWGIMCPTHYIFNDPTGACLVVEYLKGELNMYDNPLGVITNAPHFEWHMINCSNYVNLGPKNYESLTIDGNEIPHPGEGSGLLGMPGDFTPASRFIRAMVFKHTVLTSKNAHDTMLEAFHILNNFDIPRGSIRAEHDGKEYTDHTQWTSAIDCTNKRYYFHNYDNRNIRMIDLNKCDLDAKAIRTFVMEKENPIEALV